MVAIANMLHGAEPGVVIIGGRNCGIGRMPKQPAMLEIQARRGLNFSHVLHSVNL